MAGAHAEVISEAGFGEEMGNLTLVPKDNGSLVLGPAHMLTVCLLLPADLVKAPMCFDPL